MCLKTLSLPVVLQWVFQVIRTLNDFIMGCTVGEGIYFKNMLAFDGYVIEVLCIHIHVLLFLSVLMVLLKVWSNYTSLT